jgi:phosphate:Na+ symporter
LRKQDEDLIKDMRARDNKVDLLNREISLFLTEIMDEQNGKAHTAIMRHINFASDLESAADVIENSILDLAKKKHELKLEFSDEGWSDVEKMQGEVYELCALSLSCYQTQNKELADEIIIKKRKLRDSEAHLREKHILRLSRGVKDSIKTSSIHMDVLSDYRRVVGLFSNHAYKLIVPNK